MKNFYLILSCCIVFLFPAQAQEFSGDNFNGAWESDAQQAYCQKFKSLDGDMAQMILMINEHVDDLKEMAAQYEKSEASNTSTAGALKVDYI